VWELLTLDLSDLGTAALADVGAGAAELPNNQSVDDKLTLKVDKITGKGLSTEDYTTTEKGKLGGIASGAQVNVATNLAQGTRTATAVPITSSTGAAATLGIATTTLAGVMSAANVVQLAANTTAIGNTAAALDAINGVVI